MNKSNKNSFSSYIKKLNEIDINSLISSIQKINLKDLKKIDINELFTKISKSKIFKPSIGLLFASVFFGTLLLPSFEQLLSTYNKARKYQASSNKITITTNKLKELNKKVKKSNILMSEINDSIINKNDIIYISKLINETAIKTDVEIISIIPIDAAKSAKLCGLSNQPRKSKRSSRNKRKKNTTNKGDFEYNYFEINLNSSYLDVITFLSTIQYYDVVILPNCLQVLISKDNRSMKIKDITVNNPSRIIPIPESGLPDESSDFKDQLDLNTPFSKVQTRLVLKIPSHLK